MAIEVKCMYSPRTSHLIVALPLHCRGLAVNDIVSVLSYSLRFELFPLTKICSIIPSVPSPACHYRKYPILCCPYWTGGWCCPYCPYWTRQDLTGSRPQMTLWPRGVILYKQAWEIFWFMQHLQNSETLVAGIKPRL